MPRHPVVVVLRGAAYGVGIGLLGTGANALVLGVLGALAASPETASALRAGLGFSLLLIGLAVVSFLWASQ